PVRERGRHEQNHRQHGDGGEGERGRERLGAEPGWALRRHGPQRPARRTSPRAVRSKRTLPNATGAASSTGKAASDPSTAGGFATATVAKTAAPSTAPMTSTGQPRRRPPSRPAASRGAASAAPARPSPVINGVNGSTTEMIDTRLAPPIP